MPEHNTLGHLSDPLYFNSPIAVSAEDYDMHILQYENMLRIRKVENRLALAKKEGLIGGPVHLGAGQEAVAVGVAGVLRKSDRIFGAHRSHSHVLSMGSSVHKLFAEVLGRDTGLSRGMGGSMHLWDQPNGFYGSVPIVAGTVPLAVGAGLAAKLQGCDDIGVAYLGDGAVEEGVVHESLNFARMTKSPVLFVVENNLFASHMHISLRQPSDVTARFAIANDIPCEVIDGNDVVAVFNAAKRLVDISRSGNGPVFLEAITYRWYGHVDWREDIDVGVNRSADEVNAWRERDPISRLREGINLASDVDADIFKEIEKRIDLEIEDAWQRATLDPYPQQSSLFARVYMGSK